MADVSITAASVLSSTTGVQRGTAGATITQGQVIYSDASDSNKLKLADANASSATKVPVGIALNAASSGQPLSYTAIDPSFTVGATLNIGDVLYLSNTAGGITATYGDLSTGSAVVVLGVMITTTTANLNITIGGTKA